MEPTLQCPDCSGNYPFQKLLWVESHYSSDYIMTILVRSPMCAHQVDKDGRFPLYVAFCRPDMVMLKLISLYPVAIESAASYGEYPLHIARRTPQFCNTIYKIIEINPNTVKKMDMYGTLPLHNIMQWSDYDKDDDDMFSI
jgi:hypothetical protein